jgi:hypothetical protein
MRLVSQLRVAQRRHRKTPPATSAVRGFIVPKEGHAPVPYQSDLERQFLIVCSCLPWVESVKWEPFTLHFLEDATELRRTYTPDFLVQYQNGSGRSAQLLVETKRELDQLRSAGYMAACYAAAEAWADQQRAAQFFRASDVWLKAIGYTSYEFIYAARKGAVAPPHRRELVKDLLNQTGLTMESAIKLLNAQGLSDYNQVRVVPIWMVSPSRTCGAPMIGSGSDNTVVEARGMSRALGASPSASTQGLTGDGAARRTTGGLVAGADTPR